MEENMSIGFSESFSEVVRRFPCFYDKRSSRVVLLKKFLPNFTKFTGKRLCQILFFNKEIQKVTLAQLFSCEFCEITKNFFTEHVWATAKANNLFKDKNISLLFIQLIIIM